MRSGQAGGTKCDCARCNATTKANEKGFLTPASVAKETLTPLDLINVPIGKLYAKIKHTVVAGEAEDAGEPMYGHLPMLARLHIGQDQAESICERVLSTANQIMETGNTLLNDEELRNVVVLRFNKAFIVKYRAKLKDRIAVKIKAQFQHAGQQKETLDALYTKNVEQAYM